MQELLNDTDAMMDYIVETLMDLTHVRPLYSPDAYDLPVTSGVLLLLGKNLQKDTPGGELCLIFNKRSANVRQPGDLCFPGGSVFPRLDSFLARFFSLPRFSLGRWKYWTHWKRNHPREAGRLALFWATGLREALEEMRLNPFSVKFLGPLPPCSLVMFDRIIYPLAAWAPRQRRFYPNWEVEKIVRIPLKELLHPGNFACYRLTMASGDPSAGANSTSDFPCFRYRHGSETELLWGATYRITLAFLEAIFRFRPPDPAVRPVVTGALDEAYLTGNPQDPPSRKSPFGSLC